MGLSRRRPRKQPDNPFTKGGSHETSVRSPQRRAGGQPFGNQPNPTPSPNVAPGSIQRPPPIPEPESNIPKPIVRKKQPDVKTEPAPDPKQDEIKDSTSESEMEESEVPKPDESEVPETPTAGGDGRGIGLSALDEPASEQTDSPSVSDDDRVADLLQRSRKTSKDLEKDSGEEQSTGPAPNAVGTDLFTVRRDSAPTNVFRRSGPSRPAPGRRRRPIPQPAVRQKRLDRGRHVEYKYEVRGLMVEIGVPEEHRSSLLGSIWAKGERQDVEEAKGFIQTQVDLGNITADMAEALLKVVSRYTVRR